MVWVAFFLIITNSGHIPSIPPFLSTWTVRHLGRRTDGFDTYSPNNRSLSPQECIPIPRPEHRAYTPGSDHDTIRKLPYDRPPMSTYRCASVFSSPWRGVCPAYGPALPWHCPHNNTHRARDPKYPVHRLRNRMMNQR